MSQAELHAFLAEKKAAIATAAAGADTEPESDNEPVVTPPVKKRGPKPLASMTPAERALHDAKVAERKAAKEAKARAVLHEAAAELVAMIPSIGGAAH
jgi:hypothetical protein